MVAAPAGAIIEIASGNITGTISRTTATTKNPPITLRPQNRKSPPVFTNWGINLAKWNGLIVDGLTFANSARDSYGFPDGKNVQINSCSNMKFVDCLFKFGHESIRADNGTNNTFEYCTIERCGMDNIRVFGGQSNLKIRRLLIWDTWIDLSRQGQDNRHPDGIQFAVNGQDASPNWVVVEDCYIECQQLGADTHGIFCGNHAVRTGDQTAANGAYRNMVFRRNFIRTTHAQGIGIEAFNTATIEGNLMRQVSGSPHTDIRNPRVYFLGSYFSGVKAKNNVSPFAGPGPAFGPLQKGISLSANIVSKTAVPAGWVPLVPGKNVGQYATR